MRPDHIFVAAAEPWFAVCSGVTGGGLGRRRYFLNRQVKLSYNEVRPEEEMASFLEANFQEYSGADSGDWAGLMTGAKVIDAGWTRLTLRDSRVTVIVTAGVNNACTAGITPCCPLESAGRPPWDNQYHGLLRPCSVRRGCDQRSPDSHRGQGSDPAGDANLLSGYRGPGNRYKHRRPDHRGAGPAAPLPLCRSGCPPGLPAGPGSAPCPKAALERYLQWKKNSAAG